MAKSIATGYTDTAIAGNPAMQVVVGKLNFASDHRVVSEVPGEIVTSNVTCPVDQPETFRFSQKEIANVYAQTNIDPSARLSITNGKATLLELREVWVETDSVDTTYRKLIPVKVGIQFTIPSYGNVTQAMILTALLRAYGLIFETGTVTDVGVNNINHGVLRKADLK